MPMPGAQINYGQGVGTNPYGAGPNPFMRMNATGGAGMAGMGGPNPFAGMNPYMMGAGAGMAGPQGMPPPTNSPWANAANFDPTNAMSQLGQGTPQGPAGAWATNPSSAPPWFQAAMQSPGGIQGYWQQQRDQQGQGMDPRLQAMQAAMAQQGQAAQPQAQDLGQGPRTPWQPGRLPPGGQMPPQMPGPGGYGGILSGLMGRGMPPWAQGQPRQMQVPSQARQPVRPPAKAPRRFSFAGGAYSPGTASISGY